MPQQASDAKDISLSSRTRYALPRRDISLAKTARTQTENREALSTSLDKIGDTADYMTSIVTEISEASISERMANDQVAEPFALRSVIDSISAIIEPRAEEAQLAFEVSMDDSFDPRLCRKRRNSADTYKFPQ